MRVLILKLGRTITTIAITIIAILFSVLLTTLIVHFLGAAVDTRISTAIAIIIPLIATPSISWPTLGFIYKIHYLEEKMRRLATYDHLTGLLNRRAFLEHSHYLFSIAQRENLKLSVITIDLDHFKLINDKYGHDAGDKVLRTFGRTVKSNLRKSDLDGRIGGEEFAILLPQTSTTEALNLSKRLHSAIRETSTEYNGHSIHYTASMGIASYPTRTVKTMGELLKIADKALYKAKKSGRNQTMIYKPEKDAKKKQEYLLQTPECSDLLSG